MSKYLAIYEKHATVEATGDDLTEIYKALSEHFGFKEIQEDFLVVEVAREYRIKTTTELIPTDTSSCKGE